jgi:hypothetical protein
VVFTIKLREPHSVAGRCWNAGQGLASSGAIVLIALKLASVINWSWWWVLAPLWISGALVATLVAGFLLAVMS